MFHSLGLLLALCTDFSKTMQEMVPALIETIKELGLVLVADTSHVKRESDHGSTGEWSVMPEGINGVMKNNAILRFHDSFDM